MAEERSGPVYAARIAARLAEEQQRRTSLHTRAIAVVSTSGVIVSLLFGLERAGGTDLAQLAWELRLLLGLAVGAFLLAAGIALVIAIPSQQWRPTASDMKAQVNQWSHGLKDAAEKSLAVSDADRLLGIEKSNDDAFTWLRAALIIEIAGIALVALVAAILLIDPPSSAAT